VDCQCADAVKLWREVFGDLSQSKPDVIVCLMWWFAVELQIGLRYFSCTLVYSREQVRLLADSSSLQRQWRQLWQGIAFMKDVHAI
jgi:hypothetical protein